MTIKLALLKSGEEVISDIGEMVTDKKTVVGYYFTNPCRAILTTSEEEDEADDEIEEVAKTIKEFCGENKKILYGGSINSSNCKDILKLKEIDGALVGGASLNPKEFAMIAQSC